jgi:hypothetical protein
MTTATPTSCRIPSRVEEKDKARNEALNKLIMEHAEDYVYMHKRITYYQNICIAFLVALILLAICGGYAFYFIKTLPTCDNQIPVQVEQVTNPDKQ